MRDGFQIYDTHSHLGKALHSGKSYSVEQLLEAMHRSGVDRSLLIPFPVVEDYRRTHDQIAGAVRNFPDSFTGCVCLAPSVGSERFRDEVKRCVQELGFRALKWQPQYQPLNPLSPRSDFLWETALEFRLPVLCHTGAGVPFALPSLLISSARRFPELTIIVGHCGGSVFMYEAIVAAQVCPNIYLELSSLMPHHVVEVLTFIHPSRLMIGSDGVESLETEVSKIVHLDLPQKEKAQILWTTAHRLFD